MDNKQFKEYMDKTINDIKKNKNDKDKMERDLFILIFIITGISFIFNNLAGMACIFLIFYYEVNKNKIIK